MKFFIVAITMFSFIGILSNNSHAGCGTTDECNDPKKTNIDNGGNVGTNDGQYERDQEKREMDQEKKERDQEKKDRKNDSKG